MERTSQRGRFIVFEGVDGSGKTTQAKALAAWLSAEDLAPMARYTKEPGDTYVGRHVRSLLLDPTQDILEDRRIEPGTQALLLAADRRDHVRTFVRPSLERGHWVVCDRYSPSTIAYQGFGAGVSLPHLRSLCEFAEQGMVPDLIIYLRVPVEAAAERKAELGPLDAMEGRGQSFLSRVIDGYEHQAVQDPWGWAVIDGTMHRADVHRACQQLIRNSFFPEEGKAYA